jgi:hypothetical protein
MMQLGAERAFEVQGVDIWLMSRQYLPMQQNGWDCGLYAVTYGMCAGLQASFEDITPERMHAYVQRSHQQLLLHCQLLDHCCYPKILWSGRQMPRRWMPFRILFQHQLHRCCPKMLQSNRQIPRHWIPF